MEAEICLSKAKDSHNSVNLWPNFYFFVFFWSLKRVLLDIFYKKNCKKIKKIAKKELYSTGRNKSTKRWPRKALLCYILWCELVKNFKKQKSDLFCHILSKLLMPKKSNLSKWKAPKTLFIDFDAWGLQHPVCAYTLTNLSGADVPGDSLTLPFSKNLMW